MDSSKALWAVVIFAVVAVVAMGWFVRGQNSNMVSLSQSMSELSSTVQLVIKKLPKSIPAVSGPIGIANPASTNCVEKGGKLGISKKPDGSEYGICYFEDNRQCEEWAFFRGECPAGGVKVTGFTNDANVFCAITGHKSVESSKAGEVGTCEVNGVTCSATEFYEKGECTAAQK